MTDRLDVMIAEFDGLVAEAARFALLWLDDGVLRYPAADLGVLPSLGVRRALETAYRSDLVERTAPSREAG